MLGESQLTPLMFTWWWFTVNFVVAGSKVYQRKSWKKKNT